MSPGLGSLAVVGGGVIGLSVARRAAQAGWSVRVHRSGEPGASWVAAGMLAPHSEGWPGEERLLHLGLESLRLWHDSGFLDGLAPQVITARESLVVAVDSADAAELRTVAGWLSAQATRWCGSPLPVMWNPCWRREFGMVFGRPPSLRSTIVPCWTAWWQPASDWASGGPGPCTSWTASTPTRW
ncbi:FAD dependent oxidoreductase family protein [Mycobacterium xenopi 4042]|uniref:FAD dependent oxidoreductase family protein n=1 Tax=Mycobacterium xenopi 4042 TaxID=1299334 RepID=X8DLW9_MYCXE|nr:FAD dependent oxidoreductase family protein [Mycobacterium xenopi 4042]